MTSPASSSSFFSCSVSSANDFSMSSSSPCTRFTLSSHFFRLLQRRHREQKTQILHSVRVVVVNICVSEKQLSGLVLQNKIVIEGLLKLQPSCLHDIHIQKKHLQPFPPPHCEFKYIKSEFDIKEEDLSHSCVPQFISYTLFFIGWKPNKTCHMLPPVSSCYIRLLGWSAHTINPNVPATDTND